MLIASFISVKDDGVGFDTSVIQDDRKHVGLRNIRERLKVMVKGSLDIKSTPGVGTEVLITMDAWEFDKPDFVFQMRLSIINEDGIWLLNKLTV